LKNKNQIALKFLLVGFVFGLLFPTIAIVADCFIFNDVPVALGPIWNRLTENPIHFIILIAPIILGGTFYAIGWFAQDQKKLNDELTKTNNVMKETNELLDTFNYHVSHDLKTVLNNQLALSKMARKYTRQKNWEKLEEITDKLIGVGENGLATVSHFLVMSKEGYLNDNQNESIRFKEHISKILIESGCERRVDVIYDTVEFDTLFIQPKVFESIFINLLTNSIKYSRRRPEVRFQLKQSQEGKTIVYSDNGIGIDLEEDGDKLFRPFRRVDNGVKREGTGVGLFIVRKLVQAYSGKIEVKSELGKGTEFTLFFPGQSE